MGWGNECGGPTVALLGSTGVRTSANHHVSAHSRRGHHCLTLLSAMAVLSSPPPSLAIDILPPLVDLSNGLPSLEDLNPGLEVTASQVVEEERWKSVIECGMPDPEVDGRRPICDHFLFLGDWMCMQASD